MSISGIVVRFGDFICIGDVISRKVLPHRYIINSRIGMHFNIVICLLYSGLQGNPFDREGVFEYGHLLYSQSYVTYSLCMTYDCVDIHNHTDIHDVHNHVHTFKCMSACTCTVYELHALCNNLAQVRKRLKAESLYLN